MYRVTGALAGAVVITALACGTADALPTFASGSFAFSEPITTTSDVTTTTSFNNAGFITVDGTSGDFSGVLTIGTNFTVANPTDFTTASSLNWSDAGIGSFAATTVTNGGASVSGSGASEHATQKYYIVGNFTIGSDYADAGTVLTASETISLTQTGGAGNAISLSGTFNSPSVPPPPMPEPATLALLGAGLAGFAGIRRRKKAAE